MTGRQLTVDEAARLGTDILRLIACDPRMSSTIRAVAQAIAADYSPGDVISANDIRPHLPYTVKRAGFGTAWGTLVRHGALRPVSWVHSTDEGTHGKLIRTYLVLADPESVTP